ncbi:hypothetical protein [Dactylosporangium sp. CA-139066]|uniref:hypothetical protein n=1 Tax=Dactylosporangium sp. CA-139066 TaxID=3239930 RepID=UPI003D933B81
MGSALGVGGGFGAPGMPVTRRIPENLPFVARPSAFKRALVLVPFVLVILLVIGCPATLLLTADGPSHTSGDIVALVALMGCLTVVLGAVLTLQIVLVSSGGPVLAASPAGLWIKTRPTRGQAIWLPWEGVAEIRRRRWGLEKMVVVRPRDPRVEGSLGAFTAIDSAALKLFYGSGFTATLNFADRSEDEILAALREFSAGRAAFNI